MIRLFLSINNGMEGAAEMVFKKSLGISVIDKGDSLNVYGGVYYKVSFLGVILKLEPNDFEYCDLYNYVVFIREDFVTSLHINNTDVRCIANICIKLLAYQNMTIGYEDKSKVLNEYNISNIRSKAF